MPLHVFNKLKSTETYWSRIGISDQGNVKGYERNGAPLSKDASCVKVIIILLSVTIVAAFIAYSWYRKV